MRLTRLGKRCSRNSVNGFFQRFTGFETWLFSSRNFQRFTGLWVTTSTSRTIGYRKSTKANQYHRVASLKSASDGFDYCVQRTAGGSFRDISRCSDSINQFRLVHSKSPYIYLSMFLKFFGQSKTTAEALTDTYRAAL
ncbi:conserved hypothetical protein [Pseudomonas lundensis]|uniref:Uncharacterized protein n=1 Tax=Pseudomonas lundensis TaxID=86185 RepID=A0AAX2H566_9PSED|nr:conserved hypothetical protein [Pseudomonas lundensis]